MKIALCRNLAGAIFFGSTQFAFSHTAEFLFARLERLSDPPRLRLEVTADFEGNPLIQGLEEARAALTGLFVVSWKGPSTENVQGPVPWGDLADLRFERRSQLDPDLPLPSAPQPASTPHQLLTSIWEWQPPAQHTAQFSVPNHSALDALLWTPATKDGTAPGKWKILIAGDDSGWIDLLPSQKPSTNSSRFFLWIACLVLLGGAVSLFWKYGLRHLPSHSR